MGRKSFRKVTAAVINFLMIGSIPSATAKTKVLPHQNLSPTAEAIKSLKAFYNSQKEVFLFKSIFQNFLEFEELSREQMKEVLSVYKQAKPSEYKKNAKLIRLDEIFPEPKAAVDFEKLSFEFFRNLDGAVFRKMPQNFKLTLHDFKNHLRLHLLAERNTAKHVELEQHFAKLWAVKKHGKALSVGQEEELRGLEVQIEKILSAWIMKSYREYIEKQTFQLENPSFFYNWTVFSAVNEVVNETAPELRPIDELNKQYG